MNSPGPSPCRPTLKRTVPSGANTLTRWLGHSTFRAGPASRSSQATETELWAENARAHGWCPRTTGRGHHTLDDLQVVGCRGIAMWMRVHVAEDRLQHGCGVAGSARLRHGQPIVRDSRVTVTGSPRWGSHSPASMVTGSNRFAGPLMTPSVAAEAAGSASLRRCPRGGPARSPSRAKSPASPSNRAPHAENESGERHPHAQHGPHFGAHDASSEAPASDTDHVPGSLRVNRVIVLDSM